MDDERALIRTIWWWWEWYVKYRPLMSISLIKDMEYYIISYHMIAFASFSHQFKMVGFNWSLSKSKSPWQSRTHLSIQADFNKAVALMVSILSLISSFPVSFLGLWKLFQGLKLLLVSLILCSIAFTAPLLSISLKLYIYIYIYIYIIYIYIIYVCVCVCVCVCIIRRK